MVLMRICAALFAAAIAGSAQAGPLDEQYEDVQLSLRTEAEAMSFLEKNREQLAPDGTKLLYGTCEKSDTMCRFDQVTVTISLPFAYKGHLQSQRNLARCLTGGCGDALQQNITLGCAWRIVASIHAEADADDVENMQKCTRRLSASSQTAARMKAAEMADIISSQYE